MNDKKIITQKELNYIETLYLNCNIEDFDNNEDNHSTYSYFLQKEYLKSNLLNKSKYLGFAKGRDWYQLENYRLGLMEYNIAKNANQYNLVIQYEQKHMFELDKNLTNLDLPFDGLLTDYKIKRIDITKIAKHNEDFIEGYNYISPYRAKRYEQGTIYLGHRSNGNVFRIYNKTKELLVNTKDHPIDYKKIALLSNYFGDIENLYTYELELQRSYLKDSLGIDTLADLPKVYDAYNDIVGRIRIYKDTDHNKRLIASNNRDRIKGYKLTDFKKYERIEKKRYSPSLYYAVKRIIDTADRYIDTMGLERSNEEYMKIFNEAMKQRIDFHLKDLVITYEETDLSRSMQDMTVKHDLMRLGQEDDDILQKEANIYFG